MKEIWKDISGYEGYYQVSNLGRVKSLERTIIQNYKCGKKLKRLKKSVVLKQQRCTNGYLFVNLSKKNKRSIKLIHRLVAIHFIDNLENKPEVNHKDLNKKNNNFLNLEWCTPKENTNHYINKLNINKNGSNNNLSILNENQVYVISFLVIHTKTKLKDISKKFNISVSNIGYIKRRKTWSHLNISF